MSWWLIALLMWAATLVGFTFGYVVCAGLASARKRTRVYTLGDNDNIALTVIPRATDREGA